MNTYDIYLNDKKITSVVADGFDSIIDLQAIVFYVTRIDQTFTGTENVASFPFSHSVARVTETKQDPSICLETEK
jgi:hypothetical protein